MANDIPSNVLAAIQAAAACDLYAVTGTENYDSTILKTGELQFDSGAMLQLTQVDAPFLVICARQVLFRGAQPKATITCAMNATALAGNPGKVGTQGQRGGPNGELGADGGPGAPGTPGQSRALPIIYFLTEQLVAQPGVPVNWTDFCLSVGGIDGGAGGPGGNGGDGGAGGPGRAGKDGLLSCEVSATSGGIGGRGGTGGPGGPGGNGSDGASLVYVGPDAALAQMSFVKVINTGGNPGVGGTRGRGGTGGQGGPSGAGTNFCVPSNPGYNGPNGVDGADGVSGQAGQKGTISLISRPDLSDLFS
jgi:hypothetical protein